MPYTQNWGVSRNAFQSPLSYGSIGKYTPKPKKKEEEEEEVLIEEKPVDVSDEAEKDIITQNNEKAQSETRSGLDKFQDMLTLGGLFNPFADVLNTAISGGRSMYNLATGDTEAAKKHAKNAAIFGFSAIPGAGDVFAAANMVKKGTQFVDKGSKMYKTMKGVGVIESAISGKNLAEDVASESEERIQRNIASGDPRKIGRRYGLNT